MSCLSKKNIFFKVHCITKPKQVCEKKFNWKNKCLMLNLCIWWFFFFLCFLLLNYVPLKFILIVFKIKKTKLKLYDYIFKTSFLDSLCLFFLLFDIKKFTENFIILPIIWLFLNLKIVQFQVLNIKLFFLILVFLWLCIIIY